MDQKSFIFLYLDFDGVLHPDGEDAIDKNGRLCHNPNLFCWLGDLEQVLDDFPQVRIIVSSDWRRLFDDESLIAILKRLGWRFHSVVECIAPSRYAEILQDAESKKISYWLALDDHQTIKLATTADERLIFCNPESGIGAPARQEELKHKIVDLIRQMK